MLRQTFIQVSTHFRPVSIRGCSQNCIRRFVDVRELLSTRIPPGTVILVFRLIVRIDGLIRRTDVSFDRWVNRRQCCRSNRSIRATSCGNTVGFVQTTHVAGDVFVALAFFLKTEHFILFELSQRYIWRQITQCLSTGFPRLFVTDGLVVLHILQETAFGTSIKFLLTQVSIHTGNSSIRCSVSFGCPMRTYSLCVLSSGPQVAGNVLRILRQDRTKHIRVSRQCINTRTVILTSTYQSIRNLATVLIQVVGLVDTLLIYLTGLQVIRQSILVLRNIGGIEIPVLLTQSIRVKQPLLDCSLQVSIGAVLRQSQFNIAGILILAAHTVIGERLAHTRECPLQLVVRVAQCTNCRTEVRRINIAPRQLCHGSPLI